MGLGVVLFILAIATKPSARDMRQAISKQNAFADFAVGLGDILGTGTLKYNDYLVFATLTQTSIDGSERLLASGFMGYVSIAPVVK